MSASSAVSNSMMPQPLERPWSSLITSAYTGVPTARKWSFRSCHEVDHARFYARVNITTTTTTATKSLAICCRHQSSQQLHGLAARSLTCTKQRRPMATVRVRLAWGMLPAAMLPPRPRPSRWLYCGPCSSCQRATSQPTKQLSGAARRSGEPRWHSPLGAACGSEHTEAPARGSYTYLQVAVLAVFAHVDWPPVELCVVQRRDGGGRALR